jgi:hypothetical protein
MKIKRNFIELRPPLPNAWYRMVLPDEDCVGSVIQNQHVTANFWIAPMPPSSLNQAQEFFPGAEQYDDILPWQDELWVYCDTAGAALTFCRVYKN